MLKKSRHKTATTSMRFTKSAEKIQELFDISSSEFQAARYRGKHERFGDILVWIFDERSKRAEQAPPILSPNKNGVGTKEIEIAALDQEILLLSTKLASKIAERYSFAAH